MFRRPVVRRRGAPLLGTAVLGGAAYAAGKSAQRGATREQVQEQRLSQLEQQGMGMPQQGYQSMPPASQSAPQQGMGMPPASQSAPQQGMGMPRQGYQNVPPASQSAPQQTYQQQSSPQPQAYQQTEAMSQEDSTSQAASASDTAPDKLAQLKTLGELRSSGVLTDIEFEAEKQKILRS